jgi:hypothetical protein
MMTFAGEKYSLKSFEYHSPSENTIDGKYYAMEAQHIHTSSSGHTLVVSVMMDVGSEDNPYLDWYLWPRLAKLKEGPENGEVASPYDDFMPEDKSYLHWVGSMTTPPCQTNTTWILLQTPVNISAAQLATYRSTINVVPRNQLLVDTTFLPSGVKDWDATLGINIRPTQPLGLRQVARYTAVQPSHEDRTIERLSGWIVLISGLLLGLLCLCMGVCLYSCAQRRQDVCGWETLGCDSRTVSRTNSQESTESVDEESARDMDSSRSRSQDSMRNFSPDSRSLSAVR